MSTLPLLASLATFVGAVCLMGGAWAWIEVWRTQRRAQRAAADEARRDMRVRLQAVIDAEVRLHGRSRLSHQLVADAMADGVPA